MEKSKAQILSEIIQDFRESEKKWQTAQKELEADSIWQEMQKWTCIDWNDGREEILRCGVTATEIFGKEEWSLEVQDHCFIRNFPALRVRNAHLTDCIFAHCGRVAVEEGTAVRCVFAEVDTLFLDNMKVYDSVFQDLHCDQGGMAISMEDSTVSGCKFKDIRLENSNFLCDGVGDCLIEKCSFERVSSDRADRQLFTCQDTKGKIIRRTRDYDMVDRASCTGLEFITDQFGAIEIGSFELGVSEDDEDENI